MKFNIPPYYDDFDETNEYYRVLFRPGVGVQTREMNQLQSILQNQISKVGNHLFKDGSLVIPGQVQYNDKLKYLKVSAYSLGTDDAGNPLTLDYLEGLNLNSAADGTGVQAHIIKAIDSTNTDPVTLVLLYTSGTENSAGTGNKIFTANQTLYVIPDGNTVPNTNQTITVNSGADYTGRSVVAGIQTGVYYYKGTFVTVPATTISIKKYADTLTDINARIGVSFTESIVTTDGTYLVPTLTVSSATQLIYTGEGDTNLYDNASGSPNANAPGAHRYKITPNFITTDLDQNPTGFYELIRVEGGVLQEILNSSQYNVLEETLARRTYDEMGNFVLDDFRFEVREARNNNQGIWAPNSNYQVKDFVISSTTGTSTKYFECIQTGISGASEPALINPGATSSSGTLAVDETTTISDNSVIWRYVANPVGNRGVYTTGANANSSNLVAKFGVGKAYVQGYEIAKTANSNVILSKGRDARTENNRSITQPQGNYLWMSRANTWGVPDISTTPQVLLYDRFANTSALTKFGYGNPIGTARITWIEPDVRGGLRVNISNLVMNPGKTLDKDVNRIIIPDATTSNVAAAAYALTGTVKYAGNTTSSYLVLGGTMGTSSQAAGASLIVSGTTTNYLAEVQVGDLVTLGSSSYATTSSWQVVAIPNSSTLVLSGGALQANASTSVYLRFAAQTVFGHAVGAAVSTRFQSEYRIGDTFWMYTSSSATTGQVINIINENRMLVSSTMAVCSTASLHGTYYSGRAASFCSDIWSAYQLGINARKLTGLYTISDYSASTTSATIPAHGAIRITGSNDAKLLTDLVTNEYVDINNNRIFITKISSNTVAFGVCLDGAVSTSGTVSYPAFKVDNFINETSSNTLIFPVANYSAVSSVLNNIYTVYKSKAATGVTLSGTTCVVTIDSAVGNNGAEVASSDPAAYFVAHDGYSNAGYSTSYTVTAVNIAGNNVTLTINGTWANTSIRVIYPVTRSSVNAGVLGYQKFKSLVFNATTDFLTSSAANVTRLPLGQSDVYKVVKVLMAATSNYVAAWSNTIQQTALDVTNRYALDNGQRDNYYDIGALVLKPGYPTPTGSIRAIYDYFYHTSNSVSYAGDFFVRSSYSIPYENIPIYNGVNLGDVLDYRCKVNSSTGLVANAAPPRYLSNFTANISYYLGRKEMIFLDRTGTFYHTPGVADVNPQLPKIADQNNAVNLFNLTLTPYTLTAGFPHVGIQRVDNRRYTMRDIGRIETRVTNLEEATALSLLEVRASSLQIRDNLDPTLERYKTGFFVDNFKDASNAETGGDARFSLDTLAQTLQSNVNYYSFPLVEKTNYTTAQYTSSELIGVNSARAADNYAVTGKLLTLAYTTSTMLQQRLATTSLQVAAFLTVSFLGSMKVTPDTDIYENIRTVNQIVSASSNLTAAGLAAAVAAYRATGNWRPYNVGTETINVYIDSSRTSQLIPWCRANTLLQKATGMRPNTKHYPFFDDLPVEGYCTGAVKLTFDAIPILDTDTARAAAPDEWPRWRSHHRWEDVEEVTRAYQLLRRIGRGNVWVWVYEYGWFHKLWRPKDRDDYLPSVANKDSFKPAFTNGPVVYYYENNVVVGSGVIAHQDIDQKTCYLVNARGKLSDKYIRSQASVTYTGNFYISIDKSEVRKVYPTVTAANLTSDASGYIYSDAKGVAIYTFDLPDTDTVKFVTGVKPVVLTDDANNNPDLWSSRAEATYTCQGFNVTITNNYASTESYVARPYDPIAQSFMIPTQYDSGAFISDIDIFFQAKPVAEQAPVALEIRTCDNTGRPSGTEMVPGSLVIKYPQDVVIDANYGQIPTNFKFNSPIYLMPGKNYAFILRSDTKAYRVWIATLGAADVYNTNSSYSTQAVFGSLFKSQDGTLWTEDQLSDIKFNINRCVFNTADAGATVKVINHKLETTQLPANPFTFVHGSNRIRVGQKNHGFSSGDSVRFYSSYWNAQQNLASGNRSINGINVGEIFGKFASATATTYQAADTDPKLLISDVTLDTYTVTVSSVANLGTAATTGVTALADGGDDVFADQSVLYHIVKPNAQILTFQPTTLSFTGQMLKGFTYDTDANAPPTPYNWFTKQLNWNTNNVLDTSCVILSDTIQYDRTATTSVTAGGAVGTWKNSFIGTIKLASTDNAVSPAIDLSTLYLDTVQHRIDNPNYVNRLGTSLPLWGTAQAATTSTIYITDLIANSSQTISFDGSNSSAGFINTATPGLFSNVIPGRYIFVSGSSIAANNFTSTALLVTGVDTLGQTLTVSGALTTTNIANGITIRQYNDFTEEFTVASAATDSKYISNIINLKNPATQFKLQVECCVPSAADFDVYYKTGAAGADFNTISWTRFIAPNQPNALSSYATLAKSDQRGVFTNVDFNISGVNNVGTPVDLSPFTAFQVKLVMRSSNAARIPQFRNLRVIAHA